MATSMKTALVKTPVSVAQRSAARASRVSCVVRAENTDRRQALVAVVAGATALFVAKDAEARTIPFKESIIRKDPTSTYASMSAYDMEGTKKRGISVKRRKKLLAAARERAAQESQ